MEKSYADFRQSKSYLNELPDDNEFGHWVVLEADKNPDYHGCHCVSPLMVIKGTFREAVERALQIPDYGFYCYGYGDIKKIEFNDLTGLQGEGR